MNVYCIRDIRYADIFLLDATMILPHGQGLLFPLSLSLTHTVCVRVCMCTLNLIFGDEMQR
jgi:hypothetical protein